MAYILNIHTSTETAIVNLISDDDILCTLTNTETNQHASFLHIAIESLFHSSGLLIKDLNAIGISVGPGSYTGIRIGLATAKGLCYALNIPMIAYNSLELLALSAIKAVNDPTATYCPMIDARRMEVYTALYNYEMDVLKPPSACIIDENWNSDILSSGKIYFSGSGHFKFQNLSNSNNAFFVNQPISTQALAAISLAKFKKKEFENTSGAQPLYIKDFHSV